MKIRVLIASGHTGARHRLRALLSEEGDVDVIGAAATGAEAVDAVRRLAPDLVLLDPRLPEFDGFGVIAAVGADRMPPTIVVTGDEGFALQAFECHALDYLVEPFDRERFRQAMSRARHLIQRDHADRLSHRLIALVEELKAPPKSERLLVRVGGRVVLVDIDQIEWIEAQGNYVRLHLGSESYLARDTMINIMTRVTEGRFFRIHRSRIVRIDCVRELRLTACGDYDAILKGGQRLRVSRLYKDAFQKCLATNDLREAAPGAEAAPLFRRA